MKVYINNKELPFEIQSFNINAFTEYPSTNLLLSFTSNISPINSFQRKITDIILKTDSIIAGELHNIDARIAHIDEELIDGQVKAVVSIHFNT
jgi:hypothetical protein